MEKAVGTLVNLISLISVNKAVYLVHKLFSTPRKGKLSPKHLPNFLQQAKISTFIFQEELVYTYQWNAQATEKPLILLIHGWESNSARWEEWQTYVGTAFRLVAFDAPSLGQSKGKNLSVKNYQEVIDIAIEHFQPQGIIAHSLGAFTAFQQLSAKSYPTVQKVVLLGTFDRFEHILAEYFTLLGYKHRLCLAYLHYVETLLKHPLALYSSTQATQNIHIPVLCIHDRLDEKVSYQEATAFHQALQAKNNRVVSTANLGHSLQDAVVFETILTFLS